MPAPLIPLGKGAALWIKAALLAKKSVLLSGAAFKAAALGTAYMVKGVTFTKVGAATLAVLATPSTLDVAADATYDVLREIGFGVDALVDEGQLVREIAGAYESSNGYRVRFCVDREGAKVIVPEAWKVCPYDNAAPLEGVVFEYREAEAAKQAGPKQTDG
ncbi:MAG: hypothetical protein AAFX08_12315 [Pseudomonadota bacterium]